MEWQKLTLNSELPESLKDFLVGKWEQNEWESYMCYEDSKNYFIEDADSPISYMDTKQKLLENFSHWLKIESPPK